MKFHSLDWIWKTALIAFFSFSVKQAMLVQVRMVHIVFFSFAIAPFKNLLHFMLQALWPLTLGPKRSGAPSLIPVSIPQALHSVPSWHKACVYCFCCWRERWEDSCLTHLSHTDHSRSSDTSGTDNTFNFLLVLKRLTFPDGPPKKAT